MAKTVKDSISTTPKAHEPDRHDDSRHAYDIPGLSAREFLFAVMNDHTIPLVTRMDAAHRLLRLGEPEGKITVPKGRGGYDA